MSDEIWQTVRIVNFCLLFASFMIMVYKGVFNLAVGGKLKWDRMLNLCWVVLAVYSIAEVVYLQAPGGVRVFAQTAVALLQLYVVMVHFDKEDQ